MEKNKKYNQLLITAKELFWKFGIKRVSIEEICRESRVSKMTFYKFFSNKSDLVKTLLDKIITDAMDEYHTIMRQEIPFSEKVQQSIHLKMKSTSNMSQEFMEDLLKYADPEILDFYRQRSQENLTSITTDYINAQKSGKIRQDIKPEFIIYFLNHMMGMLDDPSLKQIYPTPQEMIMELTRFFFYGILTRDNQD